MNLYILGISAFYHDSAACLLKDGEILSAVSEERFSRKKQDARFPTNAIAYCLEEAGLEVGDLDAVGFYDKPFPKFERLLESIVQFAPAGYRAFMTFVPPWIKEKLFIREVIQKELGYKGKLYFGEHHESHAAAAFYPSPFQEAAFLTVDGVGEWATTSYGVGKDNDVQILAEVKYPHSLGLLYSAFTYFTGFRVNSGEYKLMGLAPYGDPKYVNTILDNLIDLKDDGSFRLNMDYFDYVAGSRMVNGQFSKLFGKQPRKAESKLTQEDMDLAASIQIVTEQVMDRMTRHLYKVTGQKNLCLAGGVALNCVSNGKILREGPFEKIWIQPAAGDAGSALGIAQLVWHKVQGNPRTADGIHDTQKGSYLGPEYRDDEIEAHLQSEGLVFEKLDRTAIADRVAELIAGDKVVGWFQGRMEFGPRALGSRSIIGNPMSREMQTVMNVKIKFRESFRPFAPSVLVEDAADYFEINTDSPYMMLVAPVKDRILRELTEDEKKLIGTDKLKAIRSELPAITHVDNSARLQTVAHKDNPLYHEMISAFKKRTGCSVIINTSFNVRGEPIVCRPAEAVRCFLRTNMDYLMIGNYLLDKTQQTVKFDFPEISEEFELD